MNKQPTPELTKGQWWVGKRPFASNAEAWRWIDQQQGSALSPAEQRTDYWWGKFVNDE
jgi:hypothetical protein